MGDLSITARSRETGEGPAGFSGAVLCGGESRRMGEAKALLAIDGRAMAVRVADALWAAGAAEVWAVGGDVPGLGALGLTVVTDDEPGAGPLPATITALRHARSDIVVVLACDLLRPAPEVVRLLVRALRRSTPETVAAVPVVDGHRQWTHTAWRTTARSQLEAARHAGTSSLRRAAGTLCLLEVPGIDPEATADADTPEALP